MDYEENSFLAGIAVGRSLKGWSGGQGGQRKWQPYVVKLEPFGTVDLTPCIWMPFRHVYQLSEFEGVT